jgi:hypothetical protein
MYRRHDSALQVLLGLCRSNDRRNEILCYQLRCNGLSRATDVALSTWYANQQQKDSAAGEVRTHDLCTVMLQLPPARTSDVLSQLHELVFARHIDAAS